MSQWTCKCICVACFFGALFVGAVIPEPRWWASRSWRRGRSSSLALRIRAKPVRAQLLGRRAATQGGFASFPRRRLHCLFAGT